ncbi:hypothetical protein ANN_14168 [Periplaneta americana]|uniref:Uncharacterized protein n=1 Tax=Periplaneta americana TaxID=6978 RepID=A0ABQ8SWL7_PERAM|nr:hypothetical protein ANN_14168 [Periplaneta americana]
MTDSKGGQLIRVCSKSFCNLFAISKKRLSTAREDRNLHEVTKKQDFESNDNVVLQDEQKDDDLFFSKVSPHIDKRGLHGNYKHKLSPSVENRVVNHIKKFPLYVSHYGRSKSQEKFIKSVKSISEKYRLYKEEKLKEDTFEVCDAWLSKEDDVIPLQIRLHQAQAISAYSLLSNFKSECLDVNCDYCLITYDELWKNVRMCIHKTAEETIGKKGKVQRNEWFDEECQIVMQNKNRSYIKMIDRHTRQNRQEYEENRRDTHKVFRRKKREFFKAKLEMIQCAYDNKEAKTFYTECSVQSVSWLAVCSHVASR